MAYTKLNLRDGDTLTAAHFAHIESGIATIDEQSTINNPSVIMQATAPSDTSVIWVDTDDDTIDDENEIKNYVVNELAKQKQLKPEFANSINECVDTTKMYVLPDGFIYAYFDGEEITPLYINQISISTADDGSVYNGVGYKENTRYSASSKVEKEQAGAYLTGWIPVNGGDVIRLKNIAISTLSTATANLNSVVSAGTDKEAVWAYYATTLLSDLDDAIADADNNLTQFTIANGTHFIRLVATYIGEDSVITINEEITSSEVAEVGWKSTGHAFVPADYEDRIIAIENALSSTIFGIVDEKNSILLAGNLSSGTYTLKYQNIDGTATEIGHLKID